METIYIQSATSGKIYCMLKSVGENQLKSGKFIRVSDDRVERIKASLVR